MEERTGALITASQRSRGDTVWTNSSRLGSADVGAACAWRTPTGWTRRHFFLERNKEVYDAKCFAIWQALGVFDQR